MTFAVLPNSSDSMTMSSFLQGFSLAAIFEGELSRLILLPEDPLVFRLRAK